MQHLFLSLGIIICIILAKLAPSIGSKGGILMPEITSRYMSVFILFLINGYTLPTETLKSILLRIDAHLFIQIFTFVVFPFLTYIIVYLLGFTALNPALLDGILILSTMPPPVSSALYMTKSVGGNVAVALFNSAFGSLLGVFVTPSIILMLFGVTELNISPGVVVFQLFLTVFIPLIIGQIIRLFLKEQITQLNIPFLRINQFLIFFIIYTTFCSAFAQDEFNIDTFSIIFSIIFFMSCTLCCPFLALLYMGSMSSTIDFLTNVYFVFAVMKLSVGDSIAIMFSGSFKNIAIVTIFQLFIMVLLLKISSSSKFYFDNADIAAIVYCGTHKSITLGIPVIDIIFEGNPNKTYFSVPLLIYNPLQIILGGLTEGTLKNWLQSHTASRRRILPMYKSNN